jgi:thiol-disulfide isomerase/thioredoxin
LRALAYVSLLACYLGLIGCSTFGKKSQAKPNPPASSGAPDWVNPAPAPVTQASEHTLPAGVSGLLAGRVLDSYDHSPPPTYIQVVSTDSSAPKGAPLEVATDGQGFFTIAGLQTGVHYELIARTREGEARLAGRTWATPPNPRVLIYMSSDFANQNIPPPPAPPTVPGQKNSSAGQPAPKFPEKSGSSSENGKDGSSASDNNRDPTKPANINGASQRQAEIGAPVRLNESPSTAAPVQPRTPLRPESIAEADSHVRLPPTASIPNQSPPERPPEAAPYYAAPIAPAFPPMAARVPSCVLIGQQLENFALYDLSGQPWEYRNHRGRVVLLDFWGTWCVYCRQAMPHLRILQNTYGRNGLEVIGIAYESGSLDQQVRKVQDVRDHLGINYRLLLGGSTDSCPVLTQFQVTKWPTLVLLDANNRIIWRSEGLEPYKLQELEMLIRQQLGVR